MVPILTNPATICFIPGIGHADFGEIYLTNDRWRASQDSAWSLPNRATEALATFVGEVAYDVISDKSGPYSSLPGEQWVRISISSLSPSYPCLTLLMDNGCHDQRSGDGESWICHYEKDNFPFYIVPITGRRCLPAVQGSKDAWCASWGQSEEYVLITSFAN